MDTPRSLMVVIDPTTNEHPALQRARTLALAFRARVELFVCYAKEVTTDLRVDERALEKLANGLREQGIETTTAENSDATIHGGILRQVLLTRPSVVVKDTHPHSLSHRTVFPNTDWQLIRLCPAPVLFVRPAGDWGNPPKVAAAVEIPLPGEKPASLDRLLLSAAESFALALQGLLHAVHTYEPVTIVEGATGTAPAAIVAERTRLERRQFDCLLSENNVLTEHSYLLSGPPSEALVSYVRRAQVDLLVMGAVSRGWMYNVFVGSTTERILDLLPCDLLVMKPEGFESPLQPSKQQPAITRAT